jgi:type IV secretory pathway VirB10-like protein
MVDDLKRQASEAYREQSKESAIRTSDSLSLKKLTYIALGLGVAVLIVIQTFGGLKPRPDPVIAANTPPPLIKEAPPPELMSAEAEELSSDTPAAAETAAPPVPAAPPDEKARVESETSKSMSASTPEPPAAEPANTVSKPIEKGEPASTDQAKKPIPSPAEEVAEVEPEKPEESGEPEISPEEEARRELARNIVIQSNSTLASLVETPRNLGWKAEPDGQDAYLVTFAILDEDTGSAGQYVWRVNLATSSVTPLSYYARKLP